GPCSSRWWRHVSIASPAASSRRTGNHPREWTCSSLRARGKTASYTVWEPPQQTERLRLAEYLTAATRCRSVRTHGRASRTYALDERLPPCLAAFEANPSPCR